MSCSEEFIYYVFLLWDAFILLFYGYVFGKQDGWDECERENKKDSENEQRE